MNLRWSWDEPTRDLFRWVDKDAWEAMSHDPVRLLGQVPRPRLDQLAADPGFLRYLQETEDGLGRYLTAPRWFQTRAETQRASPLRLVAYFSPEFGISEALPQYSGGLGVLAGDHLKASSDLGVPLVGVGLFYRSGYFSQQLTVDGMQQERFSELDPDALALTRCDGIRISVDLAGEPLPGAGLAGRRRPRPAVPARQRRGRQHPRGPGRHRPALRRRRRAPHPPGDPPRHRRGAGAAGPRPRPAGVPHQRGPRRLPRAGAGAAAGGERPELRRGRRGRAPGLRLHDPHAGSGRHRPLPRGADGALLRLVRDRVRRHLRRAHGPRPARRRARRDPLQHGGDGAPAGGPTQRRRRAPRRGQPGHVRRAVARRADRGGPDRLGDERGPRPDVDLPGDRRPPHPPRRARVGRRAGRGLGADRGGGRRRAVAGPAAGSGAPRHLRAQPPAGTHGWPRGSRPATWPGRTACSTRRSSPSASPGASPPTSGPPSCCPSPSGCGRSSSTPTGRSRWCSPARPTRPTSRGRR